MSERPGKVFVLDTSVILYDASAIHNFEEHDVVVPVTVLEELDQFKKGKGVINQHAREFMRTLDRLSERSDLREWIPLNGPDRGSFRVVSANGTGAGGALLESPESDNRILDVALGVAREQASRSVILVSKDINLRIKARARGLRAEDYESVRVPDISSLDRGEREIDLGGETLIDRLHELGRLGAAEVLPERPEGNRYYILRGGGRSALAYYQARTGSLERVGRCSAYGILPRNAEQTFALHGLLNPELLLVSMTGPAGTGKTLLALAAALEQRSRYRQILLARPIVPLSNRDLGFLPGDVSSKVSPYMQPLWDNLGVIKAQFGDRHKEARRLDELVEQDKLQILPLAYIRGRSFAHIMIIVDEAQNLTPHEVKTIITRAGEGTKIVFTGDVNQIDTPYLDSHSNGLSYLVARLRGSELYAHVSLSKGERSELANLASRLL